MRTIQLKAVPMDVPGAVETFDYRAQLLSILRTSSPSENGFDLGTMRTALKVLDKLDAAKSGSVVDMNDDEWEYVKGRIETQRWAFASQVIADFVDEILEAKPQAKKAKAA